ncbi:MAG: hypothetical protein Q8P24_05505 [Desulfobacterales bacterium]|nr:hypothetical protein [Desulfobacterales bacterium]
MKRYFCIHIGIFLFLLIPGMCLAEAPHRAGGFVLGSNIADYMDRINKETAIPIRYMEYIREVEIKKTPGFKTGLISYAMCKEEGKILRIKLKYENSSKEFFYELLSRYRARFSNPMEWRGDPFHVVIAWKWSFVAANKDKISLILQHNIMNEEEKKGNTVKLTLTNLMQQERRCVESKNPDFRKDAGRKQDKPAKPVPHDWDQLIPR